MSYCPIFWSFISKVGMTVFAEKSKYAVKFSSVLSFTDQKNWVMKWNFKKCKHWKICKESSLVQENHHVKSSAIQYSLSDWWSKFGAILHNLSLTLIQLGKGKSALAYISLDYLDAVLAWIPGWIRVYYFRDHFSHFLTSLESLIERNWLIGPFLHCTLN